MHYIFITGGVISGLGKGLVTSSIGKLLQWRGFGVTACKIDPYLNFDAGTLRPTEHGEVWVTQDGGEIDQDLGHYERFLDIDVPKSHNITTGQVFWAVIQAERNGKYLGKTVQPIPHITDEIKRRIKNIAKNSHTDFVLVEIGGTVGDYENILFLEAARQMKLEGESVLYVHVAYLPIPKTLGEMKTKAVQHSVRELRNLGIQPDFIIGRSANPLDEERKAKIALFCNVAKEDVISDPDLELAYELPLLFEKQGLGDKILKKLGIRGKPPNTSKWKDAVNKIKNLTQSVRIGIVGKYFDIGEFTLPDAYISVIEAIRHAAWYWGVRPEIKCIDAKEFETYPERLSILKELDGIIVPGGFGTTGVEGKIVAIRYCRENNIPYLGLCFGLQLAVVEFARHVCGLEGAHSTEIQPSTPYPIIDVLPEQVEILEKSKYGGTMRLGAYPAKLKEGTLVHRLYGKDLIYERHRHRYEVNPKFHEVLQAHGMIFSGISPDGKLVEFIELPDLTYFIATQAHPEFTSRFMKPNPLFKGLVECALAKKT
jgi:CTP synthase